MLLRIPFIPSKTGDLPIFVRGFETLSRWCRAEVQLLQVDELPATIAETHPSTSTQIKLHAPIRT
jgi:hypothetical protein